MKSMLRGLMCGVAAATLATMGCQTIGTAGRSVGHAAGSTAKAAGNAASTAVEGAGDIIDDTAKAADKEMK